MEPELGFSMDFEKNSSFFRRSNFEWTYLRAQREWRKKLCIVSREKVVCCRFMMFLECFEHFKDDLGRSYFFFPDMKSEATHLVTSSDIVVPFVSVRKKGGIM